MVSYASNAITVMPFATGVLSQLSCCNEWTPFNDFRKVVCIQTCLPGVAYAGLCTLEDVILVGGKGRCQGILTERAGDLDNTSQYTPIRPCSRQETEPYRVCRMSTRLTRSKTS